MIFFAFGPDKNSWIAGNNLITYCNGLSDGITQDVNNNEISAANLQWGSLGPNGFCFFQRLFDTWSPQDANLLADTNFAAVHHISFSPGGGYFIRYENGYLSSLCRLSKKGTFPKAFHDIAKPDMVTRGSLSYSAQDSRISHVLFGAGETVLVCYNDGGWNSSGLPQKAVDELQRLHKDDWVISKNSCLCPWDSEYYFFEHTRPNPSALWETQTLWSYEIPTIGILTPLFVRQLLEDQIPVEKKAKVPTPAAKPKVPPRSKNEREVEDGLPLTEEVQKLAAEAFKQISGARDSITSEEFRAELRSGNILPKMSWKDVKKIEDISDLDGDGTFTLDEFTIAYYLVLRRAKGIVVPTELSANVMEQLSQQSVERATCDRCGKSILTTDTSWGCRVCDFDACQVCYNAYNGAAYCPQGHFLDNTLSEFSQPDVADIMANLNIANEGQHKYSNSTEHEDEAPTNGDPSSRKQGKKDLRESLKSSILSESPNIQWDDVAGLENAKNELQEAVILPAKFPQMFTGKRKATRGILLYGPPGTGKSYLAKAIATEAGSKFFSVSSSDVMSKWYGESEQLIKALFELARENRPSIIFIDELEAICGKRDALDATEHTSRMKTELMVQIDGVGHDNKDVFLLAATNLPWILDPAIRRRFQRKIHIPLPDDTARAELFRIHIGDTKCGLGQRDFEELSRRTEGLSGSDISIAVEEALLQPVKKVSSSTHWRKVQHQGVEKLTPCKPGDSGAMLMNWRKVPASKLLEPSVETEDFFNVLSKVKASVSQDEILKCKEWTVQFGTEGR